MFTFSVAVAALVIELGRRTQARADQDVAANRPPHLE